MNEEDFSFFMGMWMFQINLSNTLWFVCSTQCHAESDLNCSSPGLEAFLTSQSLGLGHDLYTLGFVDHDLISPKV